MAAGRDALLSVEPRCLWAVDTHAAQLAALSAEMSRGVVGLGTPFPSANAAAVDRCIDFSGCAVSAVWVSLSAGYAYRVEQEVRPHVADGETHWLSTSRLPIEWGACIPTACLALGFGHLLRTVLHYVFLTLLHGINPPLPRIPVGKEVRVRTIIAVPEVGVNDTRHFADDKGLCVCSHLAEEGTKADHGRHLTAGEASTMLRVLARPGPERRKVLDRMFISSSEVGWHPAQLTRVMNKQCRSQSGPSDRASRGFLPQLCVPGLLNKAVVVAAASLHAKVRPATFLARLDDVLRFALLMADCPMRMLSSLSGSEGFAPLAGLSLAGVLEKNRAAHIAFYQGRKLLGDPLQWGDGEERPLCDRSAVDNDFFWRAMTSIPRVSGSSGSAMAPRIATATPASSRLRVGCMYVAVWPDDREQMCAIGRTFARHCDWANFFVAPNYSQESRGGWQLKCGRGLNYLVVSLTSEFPDARADVGSFMATGWESKNDPDAMLHTRWWFGNTIEKFLLTLLFASQQLLAGADVFCLLELDSAFVAENLRALVRALGIRSNDPVYLASLYMGWKHSVGPHPTTGCICLTREGLRRIGNLLAKAAHPALLVPHREKGGLDPLFKVAGPRGLEASLRYNGCGFVSGHFIDVMIMRCLVAANVSFHPGLEDSLGRYYFSHTVLPCLEHLDGAKGDPVRGPPPENWLEHMPPSHRRLRRFARLMCQPRGFVHELHRFARCEPTEHGWDNRFWLSPFAVGFQGYKNVTLQRQAYRVLYKGEKCTWTGDYRPHIVSFAAGESR